MSLSVDSCMVDVDGLISTGYNATGIVVLTCFDIDDYFQTKYT